MDGEQAIFDGQHGHRVVATRTKTQEWFSPSIDGGIRPARRRGASPGTLGPPRRSVCELSSLGIHWGAHRSLFRGTVASWDGRFVGRSLRGTGASWDGRFVERALGRTGGSSRSRCGDAAGAKGFMVQEFGLRYPRHRPKCNPILRRKSNSARCAFGWLLMQADREVRPPVGISPILPAPASERPRLLDGGFFAHRFPNLGVLGRIRKVV